MELASLKTLADSITSKHNTVALKHTETLEVGPFLEGLKAFTALKWGGLTLLVCVRYWTGVRPAWVSQHIHNTQTKLNSGAKKQIYDQISESEPSINAFSRTNSIYQNKH